MQRQHNELGQTRCFSMPYTVRKPRTKERISYHTSTGNMGQQPWQVFRLPLLGTAFNSAPLQKASTPVVRPGTRQLCLAPRMGISHPCGICSCTKRGADRGHYDGTCLTSKPETGPLAGGFHDQVDGPQDSDSCHHLNQSTSNRGRNSVIQPKFYSRLCGSSFRQP